MGEKRYELGSGEPSLSPWTPRTAKDLSASPLNRGPPVEFHESMDHKYSLYHGRGREDDSREAERFWRMEKRYDSDRQMSLHGRRFAEYENRDRIRHLVTDRRSRSPRRTEKRIDYDKDVCMAVGRVTTYDGGKYARKVNDTHLGRNARSNAKTLLPGHVLEGPRRSDQFSMKDNDDMPDNYYARHLVDDGKYAKKVNDTHLGRIYYENSSHARSNAKMLLPSHVLEGPRRSDQFSMKDYDDMLENYKARHLVDDRQCWSPRRTEERSSFGKFSGYDDGKYVSAVSDRHSGKIYYEYLCHDGSSAKKLPGHHSDGPRKSDFFSIKDNDHPDCYRVGNSNISKGVDGGSNYMPNCYLGPDQAGLCSVSEYPDRDKQFSLDYDRGRKICSYSDTLAPGGVPDLPRSDISGGGSSSPSLESQHLNSAIDNQDHLCLQDELQLDKRDRASFDRENAYFEMKNSRSELEGRLFGVEEIAGRVRYNIEKEDRPLPSKGYSIRDYDGLISSSPSNPYVSGSPGLLAEGFSSHSAAHGLHVPSHAIQRRPGLTKKGNFFIGGLRNRSGDTRMSSRLYAQQPEGKQADSMHAKFERSQIDRTVTWTNNTEEAYENYPMHKNGVFDSTIQESPHEKHIRDDRIRDHVSHMRSVTDNFDTQRRGVDLLCNAPSSVDYYAPGYSDGIIIQEERPTEMDCDNWFPVERSRFSTKGNDHAYIELYDGDSSLIEPSERRLRRTHIRDEISYEGAAGIRIFADENGARKIYNLEELTSSSKFNPSHFVQSPRRSDSRDIKKRLGPRVPPSLPVPKHLVKKYKPSRKMSGSVPPKNGATLPLLKSPNSNRIASVDEGLGRKARSPISSRFARADDGVGGKVHDPDKDNIVADRHLKNPEPPEKSEDFRKLLEKEFFRFLKQINETQSRRKKYVDPGKAGNLKCLVCSSNSEVFVDTESLALHAFTSKTVGYRSKHLGLHKALCVLMGWNAAEELVVDWHCEVLPKAQISAVKGDLIIWPPVVIVHSGTVGNKNPDEKLEKKLKDMGFRCILKVLNGKPANQGVMLVKFKGTLSGLEEAERLHQSYVEANKGRHGLKRLKKSRNTTSTSEAQEPSPQSDENDWYGYLGLSSDLVKLDFSTKNQCVLKSKKEMLRIADASLGTCS